MTQNLNPENQSTLQQNGNSSLLEKQIVDEQVKMKEKEMDQKRKVITEKEISDFLIFIEEKFKYDEEKLEEFRNIFSTLNEEEVVYEDILIKCQDFLIKFPFLVMEFNKLLPKSMKLAILNIDFTKRFLLKLKNRDEASFNHVLSLLERHKQNELDFEGLLKELEEALLLYPDLYEEMLIIMDVKKYLKTRGIKEKRGVSSLFFMRKQNHHGSFSNPNVILNASSFENHQLILKEKEKNQVLKQSQSDNQIENENSEKELETSQQISKTNENIKAKGSSIGNSDPEFLFFESLKSMISLSQYNSFFKLLHLYNKGILPHSEFSLLLDLVINQPELTEVIKQLTMSKIISRKHYSSIIKPLNEVDISKFPKIDVSYYDYKGEHYFNMQSSAQIKLGISDLFNNRYISVPNGSEDDKNPLKKNHYEESIFKYEDQRYETDMLIDGLKDCLEEMIERRRSISGQSINILKKVYKEFFNQIYDSYLSNPEETSEIIIERLKKRIQEAVSIKTDQDKTIKASFDRFYSKSFDYRSFKFKNNDKKYANSKAFVKEIERRSVEKLSTNSIAVLKGGSENSEYYTSFPSKLSTLYTKTTVNMCGSMNKPISSAVNNNKNPKQDKISLSNCQLNIVNELVNKKLISLSSQKEEDDTVIIKDSLDTKLKKYLPEIRLLFNNTLAYKTSIYVIFLFLEKIFKDGEKEIIKNYLLFLFEEIFSTKINNLINSQANNRQSNLLSVESLEEIKKNKISNELNSYLNSLLDEINSKSTVKKESFNENEKYFSPSHSPFQRKYSNQGLTSNLKMKRKETSIKSDEESIEMTITPSLNSLEENNSENNKFSMYKSHYKQSKAFVEKKYNEDLINVSNFGETFFKSSSFLPKENHSFNTLFYCSEQIYVIIRYFFCIYERLCKLTSQQFYNTGSFIEPSFMKDMKEKKEEKEGNQSSQTQILKLNSMIIKQSSSLNINSEYEKGQGSMSDYKIKLFIFIFKAYLNKEIEGVNQFEEYCRDILNNESYFLLNFDKLLLTFTKTVLSLPGESKIDEIIDLFFQEKQRKLRLIDEVYLSNYLSIVNKIYSKGFRIVYCKEHMCLSINLVETNDLNLKQIDEEMLYAKVEVNEEKNKDNERKGERVVNRLSFYLTKSKRMNYIQNGYFLYQRSDEERERELEEYMLRRKRVNLSK